MAQVQFQYTRFYAKTINRTVEIPDDVPKHEQVSYILKNHSNIVEEVCDANLYINDDDEITFSNDLDDEPEDEE